MEIAERQAEKDSITLIETYRKEEKHIYRAIDKLRQEQQERIDFNKPED